MSRHLKRTRRHSELVALDVNLAASPDLKVQPLGQSIDHRDPNAVQSPGDFVGSVIELPARMKLG